MARSSQRLKILCYHSVTPDTRSTKWSMPLARFRAQMQYLVERAVPVLPLLEAVAGLRTGACPSRAVVLTLDDGYLDSYEHVLPVLRSLHLPATLFVVAEEMGQDHPRGSREGKPRMNWAQVAHWCGAGLDVGVHGMRHVELLGLSDAQLETQTVTARRVIAEQLAREPSPAFAYPYGLSDARVRAAARAAGYACAVDGSSPLSCTARTDPFALRRETVYGDTPLWAFAAKIDHRWDAARSLYWFPARAGASAARRATRRLQSAHVGAMSAEDDLDGRCP